MPWKLVVFNGVVFIFNYSYATEGVMQKAEPTENSVKSEVLHVLQQSQYGMLFPTLVRRMRMEYKMPLYKVALALATLTEEDALMLKYGCLWAAKKRFKKNVRASAARDAFSEEKTDGPPVIGNRAFIGPVWEPAFAKALWEARLPVVQQYPAEQYFLDIALVSECGAHRLDVEVDGRSTHCDLFGRRKVADVIRDARLSCAGWAVKRFWVSELIENMDDCVNVVSELWNKMIRSE